MINEFRDFLISNGLIPKDIPIGRIARCPTTDKPRKKNGAFYFSGYSGWCKNFATGLSVGFKSEVKIDPEKLRRLEESESKRKADLDRKIKTNRIKAAEKAKQMLSESEYGYSDYMTRKGFKSAQVNIWEDDGNSYILIPMYYNGDVVGLQKIAPDGGKKYLYGQMTNNCYFRIGQGGLTLLCEGYLTGITAHFLAKHLHINCNVVVCFSANNMLLMSKKFKDGFIIADNDESGTGQKVAEQSGLPFYLPENVGDDLNDEYVTKGLFKTSQRFRKFLINKTGDINHD